MDKDFQNFLQKYLDNKFTEVVETKTGKMNFDVSSNEAISKSVNTLVKEITNCNINLLYAYHQWLKS